MRKFVGPVLLGVGAFLLVAGLLALVWAPGVVKKTPLDVATVTRLTGEAAKLDTATGAFDKRPIYAISESYTDSEASTDEYAVFASTSCAVFGTEGECVSDDDPDLLTASESVFVTHRESALSVDHEELPEGTLPEDDAQQTQGLVNKWPFGAEKKTYPYWDGLVGSAVDAAYDRTETIQGLEVYVYKVTIEDAPIEIGEGIDGTYTDNKEIFVEPTTGSIISQADDQQRYLADGTQVLDLQLQVTEESVTAAVEDAEANKSKINLLTRIVPLVGFIGGALCVIVGVLLMRRQQRVS